MARKTKTRYLPLDAGGRAEVSMTLLGTGGRAVVTVRAKPGSFDWLSAKRRLTAGQEQAGMALRRVWEATGARDPASMYLDGSGPRSPVYGPSEGVLEAYPKSAAIASALGKIREARLRAFLVDDLSEADMCQRFGFGLTLPMMRILIRQDLDYAAVKLGY